MSGPAVLALAPRDVVALRKGREAELADVRTALVDCFTTGPRAVLVRGLDPAALGEDAFADCVLRIGSWLGTPSPQSPQCERVARVEHVPDDAQRRGTHSDSELVAHTDLHDVLALACVRAAQQGGDSFLVSAGDLHDRLVRSAPHHLPALSQGGFMGTNPVLRSREPVSREPVPVFLPEPGATRMQCCANGYFLRMGAQARGQDLPEALVVALDALKAAAAELARSRAFRLEPGEILLWHNWSWLHGRTAFVDAPDQRRLLLRLWLRSAIVPRDARLADLARRIDADHELTHQLGLRVA